jgi:hypothetical protein
MRSKIGTAAILGLAALALSASVAGAQTGCTADLGMMIKFDADAWAYETNYDPATALSATGSQLTVVGTASSLCSPFLDLNASDPTTEYTFIWDNLISAGTTSKPRGTGTQYTTKYFGGGFRIYAGSPRNALTEGGLIALPAPGVVPDVFTDGTMILGGQIDSLVVIYTRTSGGSYTSSVTGSYSCTGGTLYNRVGSGSSLLTGAWCLVPPSTQVLGTCPLPTGWSAHVNGKWDQPLTVAATPTTWGKIKTIYR